jgi:hypothetical protein
MSSAGRPPNRYRNDDPLQRAIAVTAADPGVAKIGDVMKAAGVSSSVALKARYVVEALRGVEPTPAVTAEEAAQTDPANFAKSVPAPAGPAREKAKRDPAAASIVPRAREFVRRQLRDGPRAEVAILAAAEAAKIPERNLILAADKLGVHCQRGQWWLPG